MHDIDIYFDPKYEHGGFEEIENGVYKHDNNYCMSLSFKQDSECGEGQNAADISQYPLEDILDRYSVFISDFYENLNKKNQEDCRLEFCSSNLDSILQLKEIINKRVYNEEKIVDGEPIVFLRIDDDR